MLSSLCLAIAGRMNQNELDEEKEILVFGIHYLINYLVLFIIAIPFGISTKTLFETLLFLLVLLPIRSVQGGLHFKSSSVCFIVSLSFCIIPYFLTFVDFNPPLLFLLALLSILLLLFVDVLESKNNPMTDAELVFLNKKARKIELFYLVLILFLKLTHASYFSYFINSALVISTISFYMGFIPQKLSAKKT